jgi:large subunit ribosomal protein L25
MEMQELSITRREGVGKQVAKRLRREGRVPGIIYGGPTPEPVSVDPRAVLRIIHGHEGTTQLLTLTTEGGNGNARMAVIRELQFDPVTEQLLHVDLQEVSADRAITVRVAVHPVGEAVGVKDQQGILNLLLHELDVSCLPGQIPARIDADVSGLHIGEVLTVGDLTVPEGVRVLNDRGQAVVTVRPPMAEETPAVAAPEAAAAAAVTSEPEVLSERKPKEGEEAPKADDKKAKK